MPRVSNAATREAEEAEEDSAPPKPTPRPDRARDRTVVERGKKKNKQAARSMRRRRPHRRAHRSPAGLHDAPRAAERTTRAAGSCQVLRRSVPPSTWTSPGDQRLGLASAAGHGSPRATRPARCARAHGEFEFVNRPAVSRDAGPSGVAPALGGAPARAP